VDPGAGLDTEARGKILSPLPGIELDRLFVQPVLTLFSNTSLYCIHVIKQITFEIFPLYLAYCFVLVISPTAT
jgi:hypothetical protein